METDAVRRLERPGGSARVFRAHRAHPFYRRFRWDENVEAVKRGRKIERLQHAQYAAEYRNVLRALDGNLDPLRRKELERRRAQLEEWFNRRENAGVLGGVGLEETDGGEAARAIVRLQHHWSDRVDVGDNSGKLFVRLHDEKVSGAFSASEARSASVGHESVQTGYSAWPTVEKFLEWNERQGWGDEDSPVVGFTGKVVGKGYDGEPLVVPDMRKVYWTTVGELEQAWLDREGRQNPELVLYHGSQKKFDRFQVGKYSEDSQLGFGIHFTPDKEFAAKYGKYVYRARVKYSRMLDTTELAKPGTPEWEMADELLRGVRHPLLQHFRDRGMMPIALDATSARRAERLVREHGFDLVKYEARVTRHSGVRPTLLARAEAYVVLDPEQVEILSVEPVGKKEYNPVSNPGVVKRFLGGLLRKGEWVVTLPEFLEAVRRRMVRSGCHPEGEPLEKDIEKALEDLYRESVYVYNREGPEGLGLYLDAWFNQVCPKRNPVSGLELAVMAVLAGVAQGIVEPYVARAVYRRNPESGLWKKLQSIKPEIAVAAQKVYDEWEQDEEGFDPELGSGGICDQVSEAIGSVIAGRLEGVDVTEGGQEGDDHSWVIAYNDTEAYGVDIDPGVYETGGGYSWRKREGVTIRPDHVDVFPVDRGAIDVG